MDKVIVVVVDVDVVVVFDFISATMPCAECVVMRLRNWGHTLCFFLMVFLTLQTLYKYLPTLRTVL